MPEGKGYGPQNTASVGKDIHVIGNHVYAYSGEVAISASSSANTTMLDFTSGNYIIVGTLSYSNDSGGTGDIYIDLKMNGSVIWTARYSQAYQASNEQPIPLIIPPFTGFEGILGSDGNESATMILTGRIYGKVE